MKRCFVALLSVTLGFALTAHPAERDKVIVHLFDPPLNLTYGTTDDVRLKALPMLDPYRAFFAWRTFKSFEDWQKHMSREVLQKYDSWNEDLFKRAESDPSLGGMTSEQGAILYTVQRGDEGAIIETWKTHVTELPLSTSKDLPAIQILPVVRRDGVWQALPIGFEGDFTKYASPSVDRVLKFADRIEIIRPPKKDASEAKKEP